jgi:hypothetical protein
MGGAMRFLIALLLTMSCAAHGLTCEGLLAGETPEAWMNGVIERHESITFEQGLNFALNVMPAGQAREELRQTVADDFANARVTNTTVLPSLRRSLYRPPGWLRHYPRVKWIARPIADQSEFLEEILRAVQMAAMVKIERAYTASVYTAGPRSRLQTLLHEASAVFRWKAAAATSDIFPQDFQPATPRSIMPAVDFLTRAILGFARAKDLNSLSLLKADRTAWSLAKAGDDAALAQELRRRYGWRAYLTWGTKHITNVVRASVLSLAVLLSPEIGATAWHQYSTEQSAQDLARSAPEVREAVALSQRSVEQLEAELLAHAKALSSESESERRLAEALTNRGP